MQFWRYSPPLSRKINFRYQSRSCSNDVSMNSSLIKCHRIPRIQQKKPRIKLTESSESNKKPKNQTHVKSESYKLILIFWSVCIIFAGPRAESSFGHLFGSGRPQSSFPAYVEALKLWSWVPDGIFLDKLLCDKSMMLRSLKWEKLEGMPLKNWFLEKSRKPNDFCWPIFGVICPVKLFLERFIAINSTRFIISAGMFPPNLLLERSSIFTGPRVFWHLYWLPFHVNTAWPKYLYKCCTKPPSCWPKYLYLYRMNYALSVRKWMKSARIGHGTSTHSPQVQLPQTWVTRTALTYQSSTLMMAHAMPQSWIISSLGLINTSMSWVSEMRHRKWALHPPIFEALHNYGGIASMAKWARAFAPSTLGPTSSKNSESSSPQAMRWRKRERAYVASSNRVACELYRRVHYPYVRDKRHVRQKFTLLLPRWP